MRLLKPEEIECRVGQFTKDKSRYSVLLYKTSRTDMDILDETFGPENWKSTHYEVKGKDFCMIEVRIRFEDDSTILENGKSISYEWVGKSDCGSESNVEAEKGEASDAFKRAGFQWGIGRELYTAPKIWLESDVDPYSLTVSDIGYENKKIVRLTLTGKKNGTMCEVYKFGVYKKVDKNTLIARLKELGGDTEKVCTYYKVSALEDLSEDLLDKIVKSWERRIQSEAKPKD